MFTKQGCPSDYQQLFATYERMGADFGIMIDVLGNAPATLASGRRAIEEYGKSERRFTLVGVAQGKSTREYLACYRALKEMGFAHVALGGMLAKRLNTSHFAYVRARSRLFETLGAIRSEYPKDWLFALGCYHPKRHLRMERLGVYGSDYKGWIFHYRPDNSKAAHVARSSRYRQVRAFLSNTIYQGPLYLNGAATEVEQARRAGLVLCVVACGRTKVWAKRGSKRGSAAAADAYTGALFRAGRSYAERFASRWVILSGKYGLIPPDFRIPRDYNVRLSWKRDSSQSVALRMQLLNQGLHRFARVVVVGGRDYFNAVSDAYAGTGIPVQSVPPEPTRIGSMIHSLNEAVRMGTPLTPPSQGRRRGVRNK